MRGRVNEASNDNLAREESGETRRTDTEGGGSLFRLLRDFALASLPARFQPEWCKDGKMEEDGERERCANVVGARKEAENTPLSPRYFSLNGTRAAEMDVPCPCVFLPSPPLPPPGRNFFQSSPEEEKGGATRSREGKETRVTRRRGGRKASGVVRADAARGVGRTLRGERRMEGGGEGGSWRGHRRGGGCSWRFMTGVKQ